MTMKQLDDPDSSGPNQHGELRPTGFRIARRTLLTTASLSAIALTLGWEAVAGSVPGAQAASLVRYQFPFSNPDTSDGFGSMKGRTSAHRGLDFPQPMGTPIPSCAQGVVANKGLSGALGYFTVIRHPDGMFTGYCHSNQPSNLEIGQSVSRGQIIAKTGNLGNSTGPHLHLTLSNHVNGPTEGQVQDPYPYILARLNASDSPVASGNRPREEDGEMAQYYRKSSTGAIGRFAGGVTLFTTLDAYAKHRTIVGLWNTANPSFKQTVPPDPNSANSFIGLDDYGWDVQVAAHGGVING